MSNLIDALKKGNHTLELKIEGLEHKTKVLKEENSSLKKENYYLKGKINDLKKVNSGKIMANCFSSIINQMHVTERNLKDTSTVEKIIEKDDIHD